ncbi:MAG: hypothetical protein CSB48_04730 [Proteobacteria bacterium]|nr:MAG: hypothetical protein CSB48_04730 [Pseudomonadota bacterium]
MNTERDELRGLRVLICRPENRSRELMRCLQALGAEVESLPCLKLVPVAESQVVKNHFINLDEFDKVIFVSRAAAEYGLDWIDRYWPRVPAGIGWYAVGRKTAAALDREPGASGILVQQPVTGEDSEALLELASLQQVTGQKILIVRGEGGREHLKEVLEERGAQIFYAEVYARTCPEYRAEILQDRLIRLNPALFICLSAETCKNLYAIARKVDFDLSRKCFIMPGKRAIDHCSCLGSNKVLIPASLAETEIASCIRGWWQTNLQTEVGA